MNIALWIVASVLALAFAGAGGMKLGKPRAELEPQMAWVGHASDGQVRFVGLVELLGAVGLILPAALDIAPILVPIAASGLVVTMIGAVIVHVRLGDKIAEAVPAIVLGAAAAFVAVGRFAIETF
jgi:hypothetical protein